MHIQSRSHGSYITSTASKDSRSSEVLGLLPVILRLTNACSVLPLLHGLQMIKYHVNSFKIQQAENQPPSGICEGFMSRQHQTRNLYAQGVHQLYMALGVILHTEVHDGLKT